MNPTDPSPDNIKRKSMYVWCTALIVLLADLATKTLALNFLLEDWESLREPGSTVISIIPGFLNLRYAFNTGGAFSLLRDQFLLLTLLATVALVALIVWIYMTPTKNRWMWLGFGMIIGGAIGNLAGRFLRGGVVDFIDVYYRAYHWPTFNIADSSICVGLAIIFAITLFVPLDEVSMAKSLPEDTDCK